MVSNQNLNINKEVKLDKIKYPKIRYLLIHGCNGHQFLGNKSNLQ